MSEHCILHISLANKTQETDWSDLDSVLPYYNGRVEVVDVENGCCCMTHTMCVLQAAPETQPMASLGEENVAEVQQTTTFADAEKGTIVEATTHWSQVDTADAITDASLSSFLSRPVRVTNYTYLETDPVGLLSLNQVWSDYFSSPSIAKKLDNYGFIRANLKIKVVVNASPFYYGAIRVVYRPLQNFHPAGIINLANNELVPLSQMPGFWIYPQDNAGGEMTLPFFWPKNYLRVGVKQDFIDMGTLSLYAYSPLQSANGVLGQGVSVQIYAWAEDVVLAGPTVGLSLQGQPELQGVDEYGTGPISGPASNVARIAHALSGIPVISKFATATEMAAKSVAGVAQLFGYTNVPVIDRAEPLRNTPYPQIASSAIGYPVEKLTFDPKNELAIDPSIVGHTSDDELAVESLVTRQSYLTTLNWTTTSAVDAPLFTSLVTPALFNVALPNVVIYMTPMDMVRRMFKNWRGDIIFTFKFVASKYHKGRVRISYDPANAGVQTAGDTGPYVFNQIVDVGTETSVDVRIPYQQALAWLNSDPLPNTSNYSTSTSPALTLDDTQFNGILSMKVLTLLTAPVATSTVPILVFVRGAENMEFANPVPIQSNISLFQLQGTAEEIGDEHDMGSNDTTLLSTRSRVYMGESVRSLRHLLRRTNVIDFLYTANTNATGWRRIISQKWPPFYGSDPTGWSQSRNVANTANVPFNWSKMTPWHLLMPCFVAQRGSLHWHIQNPSSSNTNYMTVTRNSNVSNTGNLNDYVATTALPSGNERISQLFLPSTPGGAMVTQGKVMPVLSFSVPNYTPFKFQSCDYRKSTNNVASGSGWDGSDFETYSVCVDNWSAANANPIVRHFGVGTDYNLIFFLNVPCWRVYNPPAAAQ